MQKLDWWKLSSFTMGLFAIGLSAFSLWQFSISVSVPPSEDLPIQPQDLLLLSIIPLLMLSVAVSVVAVGLWFRLVWSYVSTVALTFATTFGSVWLIISSSYTTVWLWFFLPVVFWILLLKIDTPDKVSFKHMLVAVPLVTMLLQLIFVVYITAGYSDIKVLLTPQHYEAVIAPVPDEDNMWTQLNKALLYEIVDGQQMLEDLSLFYRGDDVLDFSVLVDNDALQTYLEKTQPIVVQFTEISQLSEFQCSTALSADVEQFCSLEVSNKLPNLVLVHSVENLDTDIGTSIDYINSVLQYAQALMVSRDYIISSYPQSIRLYEKSIRILGHIVENHTLSRQEMEAVEIILKDLKPKGVEYDQFVSYVYGSQAQLVDGLTGYYPTKLLATKYLWQPNRTKQLFADTAVLQQGFVSRGCESEEHSLLTNYFMEKGSFSTWFDLAPNTLGMLMYNDHREDTLMYAQKTCAIIESMTDLESRLQ